MNHTDSLGAKQLFTPLRFRCQQVFFHFAKVFFAAPSGQLVGARETYVSFSNPRQELFCHPGKFLFPSPFRTWPARWRERLYAPFRSHRQAFFPQKILWIYSMLTDYSINIPKRHIKMFAFFSSNILPPKNPATGNAGMGPSQCIPLPFRHLRYSATKLPAEPPWQLPLPAHRWRRTPNDSTLPRLPPATSGPLVRPYPAALFGHKKAGKGLPFPACHG